MVNEKEEKTLGIIYADPFELQRQQREKYLNEQKKNEAQIKGNLFVKAQKVATALYHKLQSIYASPHFSSESEIEEAISVLCSELMKGTDPFLIIMRMEKLSKKTDYKTKPHVPILNRFWEMEGMATKQYKFFDPKDNL